MGSKARGNQSKIMQIIPQFTETEWHGLLVVMRDIVWSETNAIKLSFGIQTFRFGSSLILNRIIHYLRFGFQEIFLDKEVTYARIVF